MDVLKYINNLSNADKARLIHGKGAWHTQEADGVPSIMMTDGPHGLRRQCDGSRGINDSAKATCFPAASAVASSWNRRSASLVGESIGCEALAQGVSVVLGPGVNIKRSPLCGRNFEYYSEDPYLAGELASGYVSAMQSNGVGCSLKHYAVNSRENCRMSVNAVVDERALREIYLSAFERVVKQARPYAVMASYNKINGESACHNKRLLTDILRNEWGFDGLVMSDWGACYDQAKAIDAGTDLEMPEDKSGYHERKTMKALADGSLRQKSLDRAAANVIDLVGKCGGKTVSVDYAAHNDIAKQVEVDSAVLLKNDGVLPLSAGQKILVVGELAAKPRYQGAGSSHVNSDCVGFLQVLTDKGASFTYAKGYNVDGDKVDVKAQKEAVTLAEDADCVLFFGGLTNDFEGEGYDRTDLNIPNCQVKLLEQISQVNDNIVFVAFGGSPFTMPWLNKTKALLNMYLGGQAVMEAAYDLLFGVTSPSGRLAESYPVRITDTPCFNYFNNDCFVDEHRESVFVGYRYYNTFGVPVLFPFGYGLSYTSFEYSDLAVASDKDGFEVSVNVTNTGTMDASEVVQIYVDNCDCGYLRASRELRAFDKVYVKAGQSVNVKLRLDERAFSIFLDGRYVTVAGEYGVSVCRNVQQVILSQSVTVNGHIVNGNDREMYPCYFEPIIGSFNVAETQFYKLAGQDKEVYYIPRRGDFTLLNTLADMQGQVALVRMVLRIVRRMAKRSSPSKSMSDPVAQMIYQGALSTPLVSLMSVGGLDAKWVMFIYYHANKRFGKAVRALFGKYDVE